MCIDRDLQAGQKIANQIVELWSNFTKEVGLRADVCLLDPVSFRLLRLWIKHTLGKYNPIALYKLEDDIFSIEFNQMIVHRVTTLVYSPPILACSRREKRSVRN